MMMIIIILVANSTTTSDECTSHFYAANSTQPIPPPLGTTRQRIIQLFLAPMNTQTTPMAATLAATTPTALSHQQQPSPHQLHTTPRFASHGALSTNLCVMKRDIVGMECHRQSALHFAAFLDTFNTAANTLCAPSPRHYTKEMAPTHQQQHQQRQRQQLAVSELVVIEQDKIIVTATTAATAIAAADEYKQTIDKQHITIALREATILEQDNTIKTLQHTIALLEHALAEVLLLQGKEGQEQHQQHEEQLVI